MIDCVVDGRLGANAFRILTGSEESYIMDVDDERDFVCRCWRGLLEPSTLALLEDFEKKAGLMIKSSWEKERKSGEDAPVPSRRRERSRQGLCNNCRIRKHLAISDGNLKQGIPNSNNLVKRSAIGAPGRRC